MENIFFKFFSFYLIRIESIIVFYSFENEFVNSYSRIFIERLDEEMESSFFMLYNIYLMKIVNNFLSIMGNVNSERKMIDNGRDVMENY